MVRHGETQWNLQGRIQGHTDVSLAELGRRNVRAQAKRLAGLTFAAVYASDLSRTVETAQILVNDADVSVQTDPNLREFSYGQWEGLTLEEVQARDPEDFALRFRQRDVEFAAPGVRARFSYFSEHDVSTLRPPVSTVRKRTFSWWPTAGPSEP